jgi:metal-dependent amidase/aminoacylase/carboxypeptidase family protein
MATTRYRTPYQRDHIAAVERNTAVRAAEQAVVDAAIAWSTIYPGTFADANALRELERAVDALKEIRSNA